MKKFNTSAIVINFSTINYSLTVKMGFDLHAKGIRFLDAPVSGMESRAIDGTLTIMCAGDESLFHEMQPLLSYVGNKILFMGEVGNGQLAKLINQLLFDINVAALAEILPIAAKMGLNPQDVGEIVNSGTGKSYASEYFIPRILKGEFSEGYPLSDAYKDLISSVELTFSKKIPVPILSAVSATYQAALLKGYGKEAKGAMIKVYEELSVIPGIFITTQRNYPIKRLNCRK